MSDVNMDLFAGFADDEDEAVSESEQATGYGTLIKIITPESLVAEDKLILKVGYISDGTMGELKKMRDFLINAEMSQYTSSEAVNAYSESLIADMQRTVSNSYKIIEGERPLAEEIVSAVKFNERFKIHVEEVADELRYQGNN